MKARLVGDDVVQGEKVFFALRLDTLQIVSFPMDKLLLPLPLPGEGGGEREAALQHLMLLADSPPSSEAASGEQELERRGRCECAADSEL